MRSVLRTGKRSDLVRDEANHECHFLNISSRFLLWLRDSGKWDLILERDGEQNVE